MCWGKAVCGVYNRVFSVKCLSMACSLRVSNGSQPVLQLSVYNIRVHLFEVGALRLLWENLLERRRFGEKNVILLYVPFLETRFAR
jgi:hypothetical protein